MLKFRYYIIILIFGAVFLFLLLAFVTQLQRYYSHRTDREKIQAIETYLDKISPSLIKEEAAIAAERNIRSWGCGPSSYALATLINKKFFDNQLDISAAYDNDPYEIVNRFGFISYPDPTTGQTDTIDHVWLEVYIKNKIIFIDPTVAYFGQYHGIVYHVFNVGDDMRTYLHDNYGIIDNRISILVQKAIEKIPIDQQPYPGLAIDPRDMNYYLEVLKIRNEVNLRREPIEYKDWVDRIVSKVS